MLHLEERKEIFYLTMHSTHFIYENASHGGMEMFYVTHFIYENAATGGKEGNVLFNDALNTFHLSLYGITIRHMVKDQSARVEIVNATSWATLSY